MRLLTSSGLLGQQAVVCQARPKAAAAATATAAPATEPARSRALPPSEDPEQRDRRDASTSYGGTNGTSTPVRTNSAAAPTSTGALHTIKGQRPRSRQLPDSMRAGIGMAGVPVDGPNRTVRMRRVPRYQQQQQQQRGPPPPGDEAAGVSVIDWDALDWESDVRLREEETQRVRQVRASFSAGCPTGCYLCWQPPALGSPTDLPRLQPEV